MEEKKSRTYPVRTEVIRRIMDKRNISPSALAKAVGKSKKAIMNILNKVNEPFEDTLIKIAAALGVKWRTLIEGCEGEAENAEEGGGVATQTTVHQLLDIRKGITPEQFNEYVERKLKPAVGIANIIQITILRDEE